MKLLKTSGGVASYRTSKGKFEPVDKITKEDLLYLVEQTLSGDVEFDEYDEANVKNQAQQIVYKSVVEKLQELADRRDDFIDESERLYLTEYETYSEELSDSED